MRLHWLAVAVAAVALSGCNRDPKVVARKYVESGNRYFSSGKYKEASLMYRNALKRLPKYAEGHYRLAKLALEQNDIPSALEELRRALQRGLERDLALPPDLKADATERWIDLTRLYERNPATVAAYEEAATDWEKEDRKSYLVPRLRGEAALLGMQLDVSKQANSDTRTIPEYPRWFPKAAERLNEILAWFSKANQAKPDDPMITLIMASLMVDLDRKTDAEGLLQGLIDKNKAEPLHYITLARLRDEADPKVPAAVRVEQAAAVLETGVRKFFSGDRLPKDPRALPMAGTLAHLRNTAGQKEATAKVIDQVKKCGKRESKSYIWAYNLYTELKDPSAAVRQLEEGMSALPAEKPVFQKQLMYGYALQHKNEEAAKVADEILKTNPKDTEARTLKTSVNLLRQDPSTSIKELEELVLQSTRNATARYNLGRAYLMRAAPGDLALARKQFTEAAALSTRNTDAVLGLAQTQIAERDFQGALHNSEAVLKNEPRSLPARLMHTSALMGLGQIEQARAELTAILKERPDQPDGLLQLGAIEVRAGNLKQGEALATKAVAAAPQSLRPFALLIDSIVRQKDLPRALKTAEAQVAKNPTRSDFREILGNLLVNSQRFDEALAQFQRAAESALPNVDRAIDMYLKMAFIHRVRGNWATAIQLGEKARAMNPRNFQASAFLALTFDGAGRKAEAHKVYDDALKLDPNNIVILNNYAFLLAESGGDLDKALDYAQRALQQPRPPQAAPNAMDEVQDTVAWIYIKKQLPNNAIQLLQAIVQRNPDNPTFRYHLAMALDQKGQKAEVKKHLEIALQKNPPAQELENIKRLLAKQ